MNKTERLVGAAVIAAVLATESGCTEEKRISSEWVACKVVDPRTNTVQTRYVDSYATCPPSATAHTTAHGASGGGGAGWYYYNHQPYYGRMPRGAQPATPVQAAELQREEQAKEANVAHENESEMHASEEGRGGRGGFGEAGAHGFGG